MKPDIDEIHKGISSNWIDLIKACLVLNPEDRLPVDDLLSLPLFKVIRNHKLEQYAQSKTRLRVKVDEVPIDCTDSEVITKDKKY